MSTPRGYMPRPRTQGLVTEVVDGETLLYVEATHQAFCLNAAAARIWGLCNGKRSVTAIAAAVDLDVEVVAHALGHFAESGLLDNAPDAVANLSRRRILKGVGLAAIPIILMVTAPEARAAGSCTTGLNNGGPPCNNSTEFCCTGICDEGNGTCH